MKNENIFSSCFFFVNPILPVTRMSCTSEITVAINKPEKKETLI